VIGPDGKQIGIMVKSEALREAKRRSMDLIEIVSDATPPICRIDDYGKMNFKREKKGRENKRKQRMQKVKDVKFRPCIGANDLKVKTKHVYDFLSKGCRVRLLCVFRNRELGSIPLGKKLAEQICQEVLEVGSVESRQMVGRMYIVSLSPDTKKEHKKGSGAQNRSSVSDTAQDMTEEYPSHSSASKVEFGGEGREEEGQSTGENRNG